MNRNIANQSLVDIETASDIASRPLQTSNDEQFRPCYIDNLSNELLHLLPPLSSYGNGRKRVLWYIEDERNEHAEIKKLLF